MNENHQIDLSKTPIKGFKLFDAKTFLVTLGFVTPDGRSFSAKVSLEQLEQLKKDFGFA